MAGPVRQAAGQAKGQLGSATAGVLGKTPEPVRERSRQIAEAVLGEAGRLLAAGIAGLMIGMVVCHRRGSDRR